MRIRYRFPYPGDRYAFECMVGSRVATFISCTMTECVFEVPEKFEGHMSDLMRRFGGSAEVIEIKAAEW